ncbi:hypothetical protein ACRRTK_020693 [Alexandromys fortis]
MLVFSGVQVMYITLSFLLCSESSLIKLAAYRPAACRMYSPLGICTREYFPVCGTNGRTYANKCIFCIAYKKTSGSINLAHYGKC